MAMAAAIAFAIAAPALAERIVNYAIDDTQAAHDAVEQGVPLAPLPTRGRVHLAVAVSDAVDHDVVRAGVYCSSWKIRHPMSAIVRRYLTAWDRDGAPATAAGPGVDLLVTVDRAATFSRCVGAGELKSVCITRVSLAGTVARPGAAAQPFRVEHEAPAHGVGLCAGLTRGIGLVGRAAAADMVADLDRMSHVPA